jgi:hypothetical protein
MAKYLYLLKFKDEPLFKIGIGTKNNNSSYDRIQTHINTYGNVFDLNNSYEVITPMKYSVNALETQLKDITKNVASHDKLTQKYKGKDGATEIRHIDSLDCALSLIKFQKTYISIELKKGIQIATPVLQNKTSVKTNDDDNVPKQLAKIGAFMDENYLPNINKVQSWMIYTENSWQKLELSFTDESFLFDLGLHRTQEKQSLIRYGIGYNIKKGRSRCGGGFTILSFTQLKNKVYTIGFIGLLRDDGTNDTLFEYLDEIMEIETFEAWFIRVFIKPLDTKKQIFNQHII